ncbi:hypothetical protein AMTRI_Chr09g40730 [Amborella trichopoda]
MCGIYSLLIGDSKQILDKKRLLNYSIDFGICIFCVVGDYTIQTIMNLNQTKIAMNKPL